MNKEVFKEHFNEFLGKDVSNATPQEIHNALGLTVMEYIKKDWNNSI